MRGKAGIRLSFVKGSVFVKNDPGKRRCFKGDGFKRECCKKERDDVRELQVHAHLEEKGLCGDSFGIGIIGSITHATTTGTSGAAVVRGP